jgi:hypothetical protein
VLADRPGRILRYDRRPGLGQGRRVTTAMLSMTKFDIAALQTAYAG